MSRVRSVASLFSVADSDASRTPASSYGQSNSRVHLASNGSLASSAPDSKDQRNGWGSFYSVNSAFASQESNGDGSDDDDLNEFRSPEDSTAASYRAFTAFEERRPNCFGVLSLRIKSATFSTATISQFPRSRRRKTLPNRKKPPDKGDSLPSGLSIMSMSNITSSPDLLQSQSQLTASTTTFSDGRDVQQSHGASVNSVATSHTAKTPAPQRTQSSGVISHHSTQPPHHAKPQQNPIAVRSAEPPAAFAVVLVRNLVRRTHVHSAGPPEWKTTGHHANGSAGTMSSATGEDAIVHWNETKHCPIALPRDPRHPFALIRVQVWVVDSGWNDPRKRRSVKTAKSWGRHELGGDTRAGGYDDAKMLGEVAFHLHDIVKASPIAGIYDLHHPISSSAGGGIDSDPAVVGLAGVRMGDIDLEITWNYGLFGYGQSWQIEDTHLKPPMVDRTSAQAAELAVSTSLFPRIMPRIENAESSHEAVAAVRAQPHPPFLAHKGPRMSPAEFRDRKHRQHQQTKQQQPTGNVRGQPFGALSNQPFEVDPNLFPIVMPGLGRANLSYGRYTDPLKSLDPEFQQWYGDENSVASLEGARERWSTVRRWKVETDRWKRAKGLWKVVVAEGEVAGSDKKGDAADDLDRIDDMNEDPLAKEITDPLGFHVVVSGMSEAVPPPQQSSKMRDSATTEGRLDDTADIEAALRDQVEFWSEDEDLPASGGVSRPSPLSDSKRRSDENSSPSVSSGWNVPTFRGLLSKAQDVIRSLGEESVVRQRAPSQTAKLGESTRILEKAKVQRSDVATAASSRPSYTSFLVPVNGIPEMFNRPIMVHSSLLPADVKPNRRTSTQSPLRTEMPRVRIEGPLTESEGKVAGVNHFNEDFGDVTRATMKNSSSDEFVVASNLTPAILVSEDDPDPPTLPMVCIENATVVFDNGLPLDHHPTPFGKPRGDLLSEEWGDQVSVEPRALPQSRGTKSAVVQQPKKVPLETMRGPSYLKRHSEAPKLPVLEMSRSNASSTEFSMEVPGSAPNEIQNQIEHAVGLATAVPFIAVTSASFDSAKKNATVTAKPSGTAPKIVPSVGIFQPGTVANIVSDSGEATTSKVQTPIPPRQPQAFLSDEDLSFPPYNFALALRRRTGSNESVLNQDMLDRGAGDV